MSQEDASAPFDALTIDVALEDYAADQIVDGHPASGWLPLTEVAGVEVGVWQMTPGVATDTEADEVFVVIAGAGRVDFVDSALPPIDLHPGVVVRLQSGWRTIWTVTQTLRKIAVVPREEPRT